MKCLHCSQLLTKRDNEQPCRFKIRVYCNTVCHHRHITETALARKRTCATCGEKFGRRYLADGSLASATRFKQQKYCSQDCYRKAPHSWRRQHHTQMPNLWEDWQIAKAFE